MTDTTNPTILDVLGLTPETTLIAIERAEAARKTYARSAQAVDAIDHQLTLNVTRLLDVANSLSPSVFDAEEILDALRRGNASVA